MNTVFMDTVGLIALWDESDQWQQAASTAMKLLDVPGTRLVTTSCVLLECGNAAARKGYRARVCLLRDQFAAQNDLIDPTPAEIEQAWAAYERDSAGGASIVDHISFIVTRRLHIRNVFSNDRHFKIAGFNTLF